MSIELQFQTGLAMILIVVSVFLTAMNSKKETPFTTDAGLIVFFWVMFEVLCNGIRLVVLSFRNSPPLL